MQDVTCPAIKTESRLVIFFRLRFMERNVNKEKKELAAIDALKKLELESGEHTTANT